MFDQNHKEGGKERKRLRRLKSLSSSGAGAALPTATKAKGERPTHPGVIHFSAFPSSLLSFLLPPILSPLRSSPLPPSSVFVQRDWLLRPAPGAETLANSVALHCVG